MTKTDKSRRDRIVDYVRLFTIENGFPPTVREIAEGVGLTSTGGVHRHLRMLEADGKLKRTPNRARAIQATEENE